MKGYEVGDWIHGHRIIAEARRVIDRKVEMVRAKPVIFSHILPQHVHSRREFKSAIALMIDGE